MSERDSRATPDGAGAAAARPPEASAVASNYSYWRETGEAWADEYERRKKHIISLHIQEVMLTDYVLQHAVTASSSLKVLDYGCGVGRHLRNLSTLPGVDVRGYDQSRSMVEQCLRWTGRDWLEAHVVVGEPTGRLPYADGEFDLVFTTEVLVHVRPEHLDTLLAEIVRITRGHVLHLETSPHTPVCSTAHEGCWRHDLPSAYARLGHHCEIVGSAYDIHAAYRVVVGAPPRFTWRPVMLALYRRMDADIEEGFGALRASLESTRAAEAALERRLTDGASRQEELERSVAKLESRNAELERALADLETGELRMLRDRAATTDLHLYEERARTSALLWERAGFLRAVSPYLRS